MQHRHARGHVALVLVIGVIGLANTNCGKSGETVQAPTNLAYSVGSATYTVGRPIADNRPTSTGGAVSSYSVSPGLPAGLAIDGASGVISGTPSAVALPANYTVTATNSGGDTTASLSITVNDVPPSNLSYSAPTAVYTEGTAIIANLPTSSGGNVVSYSVAPSLPPGLVLDASTGIISGTPTAIAPAATYTVTAGNSGGDTTAILGITVNHLPPSGLAYSANPAVYTRFTTIPQNTPTNSGGAVGSYSVAPTLPAGLSLNSSTGVISGTPTAVTATANYTVTATNSVGSTTASVSITVKEAPPTSLVYSANPATYTMGTPILPNTPTNGGGTVVSYSVSPGLPPGLNLSTITGVISGTPTAVAAAAAYTVTATNSVGSTTATVTISVNDLPPSNLQYSSNPAVYSRFTPITPNMPTDTGGAVGTYSVTPALPAGLSLNATTGVISGTPTVVTAAASYTVTATNSVGSTIASINITIKEAPPNNLTYSVNPATYTKGMAIPPNAPTSGGGPVISYSIAPGLPAGLGISSASGVISGAPTALAATASYTVTATNSAGNATVAVSITVNDVAPSGLSYPANPVTYDRGTPITPNTPTSSGGSVVSYSVSPALPGGLSLSATTGVISGTPTAATPAANYVVTATNSGGSTTASVNITINDKPLNLVYSLNPATYTKSVAITPNNPSSGGGPVVSYSVSPALPAGLALNTSTGIISGTPTAITPTATYTVTATNSLGSATAGVVVTVNDVAPSSLVYAPNPATYEKGIPITPNKPTSSGGAVVSYMVSPALPPGLSFSTTTGQIAGTPTAITPTGTYTVTATNSGGSTNAVVTITVTDAPPTGLTYFLNPAKYTKGTLISPNTPTSGGGAVVSYAVSPALPTGLSLSTTTGIISGTATVLAAAANYTVTATNSGGNVMASVNITVVDVPPSTLSYSANPATYILGSAIPVNVPSSTGGAVVSYSVLPALPAGLTLSPTTGIISGIPTAITATGSHTVTATNTGGSTTASVSITVNPLLPSRFAFATNSGENTVSMYTVEATTGQLRANGYVTAGTGPRSITVDPSGRFAYVANITSGNISAYTINASTGVLNPTGLVTAGTRPFSVTVDPTGKFAYVPNFESNDVSAFTINQTTGALSSIGPTVPAGTGARALTVDPTGRFAYVVNETSNDVSSYAINASTGALTSLGPRMASGMGPISITVDPTGSFVYVANQISNDVSGYTINPNTGALTSMGPTVAAGTQPSSVTVDPSGKFVYVANTISNGISGYRITAGTGVLTSLGTPVTAPGPVWVAIDPSGETAYVADFYTNQISSYSLDTSTGALTQFQANSARLNPSSIALGQGSSAVHIVPKFAYVANSGSGNVSAYSISSSGTLVGVSGSPISAGMTPKAVAVDPSGRFVYVANAGSANVSVYGIDSSTGALTSISGSPFSAGTTPSSVAVDPSGRFVYVANAGSASVSAYTINSSGALTNITGSPFLAGMTPVSLTVDPSGRFLYVANSGSNDISGYSIDPTLGGLTSLGATVPAGTGPSCVVVDATGRFVFASNSGAGTVSAYLLTAPSGVLAPNPDLATVPAGTNPSFVTVDPARGFVYVTNSGSNNVSIFTINASTGALAANGSPVAAGTAPSSISADPSGAFAFAANSGAGNISAYTISASGVLVVNGTATGAGTTPESVATTGSVQ